ncbi:hypothetical protein G7Y89_g9868 [Cudoniella acicularis]|uniref:VWFA domain-containing protein n=1 Tax=Cudoniella acicularis TaxID=354080 RepID=A0A8H4VZL6_9HELO|nr:hypothetical protein G7Y89_g9868 [Cudoniella acicularis]
MPSGSPPWTVYPVPERRSFLGSIRKLARKNSNSSQHSNSSSESPNLSTPQYIGGSRSPNRGSNPFSNPSPATRRPDRPGMNAFTTPSNEPPPAYTPSPTTASGPILSDQLAELDSPVSAPVAAPSDAASSREDPYSFLATFDTTLLIDDSGSMAGRSWREVAQALRTIAPIVTQHDSDGIDVYFLNHKSSNPGAPSEGVAPSGYRGIKRAATITEIFERVRPQGGTPTGTRVHNILKPYLTKLEKDLADGKEVKPLNLIVLTDGVPSDDVESVLISAAKKLDKLDAPPFQIGVQFFQVGNEEGAKEALEELDDGLSDLVEGGVRDIVDTVTWTGGASSSEGAVRLTGDSILKCVLGAVVKRLDRRPTDGQRDGKTGMALALADEGFLIPDDINDVYFSLFISMLMSFELAIHLYESLK